jgi:hypothetical protein
VKFVKTRMPTWCGLRKTGNSKFITSMSIWIFIVPMVVKVFEHFSEDTIQLVIFQQVINLSVGLPFSWVVFYFSAIFLTLGNVLYQFRAPKIIKDHPSYQSYIEEGKKLKQLAEYSEDVGFRWGELAKEIDTKAEKIKNQKLQNPESSVDHRDGFYVDDPSHYFWPIHEKADTSRKVARIFCFSFYVIGYLLFFFVLLQNLYFVLKMLCQ